MSGRPYSATILAIGGSTSLGSYVGLPVADALVGLSNARFYVPGSLLQARVDILTDAACRAVDTFEEGASRVSTLLHQGERVAGVMASVVGVPKAMLLAGVISKLMSRWRPRAGRAA